MDGEAEEEKEVRGEKDMDEKERKTEHTGLLQNIMY